jgi:RNA polymerase primary sigma factor
MTRRRDTQDIYYLELRRCVPMSREEEEERGLELERVRAERDRAKEVVAEVDDPSAEQLQELASAERAYERIRNQFVRANLRLVVSIASRYRSKKLPLSDLVQEGSIGMMTAVDRFEPSRGFRFSTYASWWIRHRITRAIANHGRTVRVPTHVVQLAYKIRKKRREVERQLNRAATDEELAAALELPVKKVRRALRATNSMVSLDSTAPGNDDGDTLMATIADERAPAWQAIDEQQRASDVADALVILDERENDILRKRFSFDVDEPVTLRELAGDHDCSRERVRQVQNAALRKLRRHLDHHCPA